ncbi:MAG: ABC transporter ATP-binding protein [Lachnospiraceae bacterium]|nr:ABC transporter ATP-binding protein [Lachnospiraceae bacterium]
MIKTLAGYVREYKRSAIVTPVFMIFEVVMEMIIPLLMAAIIDRGVANKDMGFILKIGLIMLVCAVAGLAAGILGGKYAAKASTGFARNLRKGMFDRIQTFSFSNIDKFSTAGLVTRLTTDVTNVQNAFQMLLRMCFRAPVSLVAAMVMAFLISPRMAMIYVVAVLVLGGVVAILMYFAAKYFRQAFPKYDELNASVQENVSGIRVVKAYVREDFENKKFQKASEGIYRIFVKAEGVVAWAMPVMMATIYISMLLLSWFGGKLVISNELATGELMSLFTYCLNILMNLMMLSMIFVMLTMSEPSARRISEVLTEESTIQNPPDPIVTIPDGSIEFQNVSFSYSATSEEPVLKNINLKIRSGETIGIIGGTGSSKTSFVNLISRLYDVNEGAILVGGNDVRSYELSMLRRKVAVVLQKNLLFSGTIYDNLRWGNKTATDEECKNAAKLACADEFIENMPDKYETKVERGGANLSGGQRQRLCIARALLSDPKVLILDDSTSAVDTATDAKIRKALATELSGTTKLIITQRISSVQNADRIIVMENGEINGVGTHEELLKTNVIYRDVYESQTNGNQDFDAAS